jgi:transformation/transcription domain-associated protein
MDYFFKGVALIKAIIDINSGWLCKHKDIVNELIKQWNFYIICSSNTNISDMNSLNLKYYKLSKMILKCFIDYCKNDEEEIEMLFLMLDSFKDKNPIADYTFLRNYFENEVVQKPIVYLNKVIESFLVKFKENYDLKNEALIYLVMNIVKYSIKTKNELLNEKLVEKITNELFQNNLIEDTLKVEILKLATLLVINIPNVMIKQRKVIIFYNNIVNVTLCF